MGKLLGITGSQGNGKDSIGDVLVKDFGWVKMSFANHLKDVASLLFGFDRKMLAGETPEDRAIRELPDKFWSEKLGTDFTPRMSLQILGTNLLRNHFHQNIWVDCLEKKILENSDKNIVITDVRFPNEIDMIKKNGGQIWRVERGEMPLWFRQCENIGKSIKDRGTDSFISVDDNAISLYDAIPELKNIHESEWKWIGYDDPKVIVKNNGALESLQNQVRNMVNCFSKTDK